MGRNYNFLTISALFFGLSLNAQNTDIHTETEHNFSCGAPSVSLAEFQKSNSILSKFRLKDYSKMPSLTYIAIKMHLIGEDDGLGHANENDVNDMLADLNKNFKDNNIQFYFAGTTLAKYNDSKNNNNNDNTGKLDADFHDKYGVNNAINFYVLKHIRGVGGFAYIVPFTQSINRMYAITSQLNDKKTSPHEMGHLFGLQHTFRNSTNTNIIERELVTRNFNETGDRKSANCDKRGDFLCDTEADPYGRDDYKVINCAPNDITDTNGDTYHPNMGNFMNYLWCPDYSFTNGQREVMTKSALSILNNKNSGFTYDAPETEQPAPSNVSIKLSNTGFNKATITWDDNSSVETGYIIEVAESGTNDFTAIAGVKANTTSYTLINFDNSKDYVFRIKASNTKANYSAISTPTRLPKNCTNPHQHQCKSEKEADTIINNVSISRENKKILENNDSGCSVDGIANYFDTKQAVVNKGETLKVSVTTKAKVTFSNNVYHFNWIISQVKGFCDWNNDGDFDDENETLFHNTDGKIDVSSTFVVPKNIPEGTYRLRLALTSHNKPVSACSAPDGEIEDYALVVKDKLSTNEHSAKNGEINIYPNPASDKLYINNVRDITTYKIIDASGKIIQSGDFTQNPIDIHSLEGGVYLLSLSHKNGNSINKRFIKNR